MSTDKMILEALATKTKGGELRFFEFVTLKFMGEKKKCYICIGLHAIYLVRRDLARLLDGGRIWFAHVEKVVEDKKSKTDFLIILNDNRPPDWVSEKLFVVSSNRAQLLEHMAVCFIADHMWRYSKVATFPKFEYEIRKSVEDDPPIVQPFAGFTALDYMGYFTFLKEEFKDLPSAVASTKTGSYKDDRGIEVNIHVHEPIGLSALEQIGRDHIRWVAIEYKQALTTNLRQFYIIKNEIYLKKMNLSDDIASWMSWKLFLKSEDYATVCMLLRRQYVPPLMDSAQDFAIIFKCPLDLINDGKITDEELMLECHLACDSLSPMAQDFQIYREMVQAKLDALLFDEDAYKWIASRLKLVPKQIKNAKIFLKGILALLTDENTLQNPDLLLKLGDVDDQVTEIMAVPTQRMYPHAEGIPSDDDNSDGRRNAWYARCARYLAFCVDGGLLGNEFQLCDVIENIGNVTPEADNKLKRIIEFLLHVRPLDTGKMYVPTPLQQQLKDPTFIDFTFNDRVMQVLLELKYIAKLLPNSSGKGISLDYAQLLAQLLSSEASTNLKASICRQVIALPPSDMGGLAYTLCPALIELMRTGGIFLATYSSAALVNMTGKVAGAAAGKGGDHDGVKNLLMSSGIAAMCIVQLKSKDDDLIRYTLTLLVNLTKAVHHREKLLSHDIIPVIIDILTSSYSNKFKHSVLTELSAVLGQMCNDESTRHLVCASPAIECLLYIFAKSTEFKVRSKVLFCLKQLCAGQSSNSGDNKKRVGKHVISQTILHLRGKQGLENILANKDWATNALMILLLLTIVKENALIIKNMPDDSWNETWNSLQESGLTELDATRQACYSIADRVLKAEETRDDEKAA